MEIKPLKDITIESDNQEVIFIAHCDASEDLVLTAGEDETLSGNHRIKCPVLGKETYLRGKYCLNEWCSNWRERII